MTQIDVRNKNQLKETHNHTFQRECCSPFQGTTASKVLLTTAHGQPYRSYKMSPILDQTDLRNINHRGHKFPPSLNAPFIHNSNCGMASSGQFYSLLSQKMKANGLQFFMRLSCYRQGISIRHSIVKVVCGSTRYRLRSYFDNAMTKSMIN